MEKEPDLAYSDRFGRRNKEYISLGCDALSVLKGRSPIQAYSDFMRSFRDTFRDFLGVIVTVQLRIMFGCMLLMLFFYDQFPSYYFTIAFCRKFK